jgi:hypothetical protein
VLEVSEMAAAVVFGVGLLLTLWNSERVRLAFRVRHRRPIPISEPQSLVRVLAGEEELREAVERATAFEEEVAQTVSDRLYRYGDISHVAPIFEIARDVDPVRHSA